MSAPTSLREAKGSASYAYLFSMPEREAANVMPPWPLLLFLHGIRERGTNVWDVTRQGVPKLLHGHPDLTAVEREVAREIAAKFVVIAPQCPPDEVWDNHALLALLDDVSRQLHIDAARVFVTGLSMGGFGTWALGLRQPGRFAAIAPICGGGRIADITSALSVQPGALRTLGVWAFHGAKDRVVPLDESERMIRALKKAGGTDVQLTVYPDAGHDAWSATYVNRDLYTWLLAHARPL